MTRTKAEHDALMQRLRDQTAAQASQLGFPIGAIVKFTEAAQREEPWYRDRLFVVTGCIFTYERVELDTWPRTQIYTAVDADLLVKVD